MKQLGATWERSWGRRWKSYFFTKKLQIQAESVFTMSFLNEVIPNI